MSMLSSTSQEIWICLRCRSLSNLKRALHPQQRRQIRATSHPRALPSVVERHHNDIQVRREYDDSPSHSQSQYASAENEEDDTSRPSPKRQLGVESLGTPAEILVMREVPRKTSNLGVIFTDGQIQPLPPALEGGAEALVHGISSSRGIADLEHVYANIDSIRDEFWKNQGTRGQYVPSEEYAKLVSRLAKSFEKKHLANYWQRSLSTSVIDVLDLSTPYSSTVLARSEWCAKADLYKRLSAPPLNKLKDAQKGSQKEQLLFMNKGRPWHAESVMQRIWGLRKEPDGRKGEMAIRVPQASLKLLLGHANEPFNRILQAYPIKLDVNRRQSVIRVEADSSTCEDVLRTLMQILDCIKSSQISMSNSSLTAPTKNFDDRYITEVEGLTNTTITRGRGAHMNEYTVHYLGPGDVDLQDVQRLLSNGARAQNICPRSGIWLKTPLDPTTSAIPKEFGQGLPLVARNTQWARFEDGDGRRFGSENGTFLPLAEKSPDNFPYSDFVVDEVCRFMNNQGPNSSRITYTLEHWEPTWTRWSQIVLGQVAFPLDQAQRLEAKLKNAQKNTELSPNGVYRNNSRLERVFATTLPGMTRALEAADSSLRPVERLQIRMVPLSAIGIPSDSNHLIPELEILVRVNLREKLVQLQSARLILLHEEQDILLPSHATDLRLMRRQYLYCNQKEVDQYEHQPSDPSLAKFIEESHLDIWGSQRLKTPNHLLLSIPRSLIPVLAMSGEALNGETGILVDYKLANIEHRSSVGLAPIGTFTPEYNTIQAGKMGGRREELAVRLGRQTNAQGRPWIISWETSKGLLEAVSHIVRSMR